METKVSITLHWCKKHNNWWVTNCPDCMVDANEESIKQEGRREVVGYAHRVFPQITWSMKWRIQLKEWGIEE